MKLDGKLAPISASTMGFFLDDSVFEKSAFGIISKDNMTVLPTSAIIILEEGDFLLPVYENNPSLITTFGKIDYFLNANDNRVYAYAKPERNIFLLKEISEDVLFELTAYVKKNINDKITDTLKSFNSLEDKMSYLVLIIAPDANVLVHNTETLGSYSIIESKQLYNPEEETKEDKEGEEVKNSSSEPNNVDEKTIPKNSNRG